LVRIGYACRDLSCDRLTGSGAEVYSLACAASAAGHEAYLICADLTAYRRVPRGPVHVALAPPRPGHRYLTGSLEYADRVYDTVRELDLDVLEFVDTAGEAYTVVRARRLLGEFGATHLVVAAHPWSRPPAGEPPATLGEAVDRHLEEYCRRHADEVVTGRSIVAGAELLSGSPTPGRPSVVWFLGDPGPEWDTVREALSGPDAPRLDLVAKGGPGPSGLVGVPPRAVPTAPLCPADLAAPPPRGTPAVLPALSAPATARLAFALGLRVVGFAGSTAAAAILDGGGALVPAGDPAALRAVLAADLGGTPAAPPPVVFAPPPAPVRLPSTVDTPLVSVVIPVRDQGCYLDEAVASARECGYAPLEIVVVDDGSTDPQTLAVLENLTDITLVRQPNRGLPAARNAGIAAARGEYVVPLDADDLLPAGFVAAGVLALQRLADLGCVGGTVHNFGLLEHVGSPVGYVPDMSLVVNTFGRATGVFRTSAVRDVGGYDESLPAYEDWDLYLRLRKGGYGVEYAPVPAQRYRRHADSMTFQQDEPTRLALTQRLLRTHADLLGDGAALPLLLTLVHLWKSRYEPSASVALRRGTTQAGTERTPTGGDLALAGTELTLASGELTLSDGGLTLAGTE
jgi:GT2 family glycosyltransferase